MEYKKLGSKNSWELTMLILRISPLRVQDHVCLSRRSSTSDPLPLAVSWGFRGACRNPSDMLSKSPSALLHLPPSRLEPFSNKVMINAKSPQIMEGMAKPCRHVGVCEKSPKTSKQQTSTIHAISSPKSVWGWNRHRFCPAPRTINQRDNETHSKTRSASKNRPVAWSGPITPRASTWSTAIHHVEIRNLWFFIGKERNSTCWFYMVLQCFFYVLEWSKAMVSLAWFSCWVL